MEYSPISGMIVREDPGVVYVNESGNIVQLNNDGQFVQVNHEMFEEPMFDIVPIPVQQDRIIYIDQNGCLRETCHEISPFFISQDIPVEDDGEIAAHILDHMYAKKPREPGTEAATKPRRRSKRREQVVEHYQIPSQQPQTPKINIIRQRLPNSLYKSISPSRPKILQGNSAVSRNSQSPVSTASSSGSPTKVVSKVNASGGSSGRSAKKEDPLALPRMYVTLEDDGSNTQVKAGAIGNGSKFGKESYFLNKNLKPFISKTTPNPVILDDLQSRPVGATGYEEEMLFDFGISEDEDEVNTCTLSSEAFSDVVFDECEFTAGLEVYAAPVSSQNNNIKALSPSRSSIITSALSLGQRSLKRSGLSTAVTLSSGMSDDDDSNQIMVSMANRRKSRESSSEWETMVKIETKEITGTDAHTHDGSNNDVMPQTFHTENDKSSDSIISPTTVTIIQDQLVSREELADSSNEISPSSPPTNPTVDQKIEDEINFSTSENNITARKGSRRRTISKESNSFSENTSVTPKSSPPAVKSSPEPTRRSSRAVKAPAWLDDQGDSPVTKKKRR